MMVKNDLKIALRTLKRNKLYTAINVFGLSVGLAAAILILLHIRFEFSYDNFHLNRDTIFRLSVDHHKEGKSIYESPVYTAPLAPAMANRFPEIETYTRIRQPRTGYLYNERRGFRFNQVCFADSTFFTLFSFPLLKGSPHHALSAPFAVVLTQSAAQKLYPDGDAIGQIVNLDRTHNLQVTGIVQDPPLNSSLQFDVLISFSSLHRMPGLYMDWNGGNQYLHFVKLYSPSQKQAIEQKLPDLMHEGINHMLEPIGGKNVAAVQSLKDIYVKHDRSGGWSDLLILGIVAALILILACINFINMVNAQAIKRSREVGIRKTIGATRPGLVRQLLTESILLSLLALVFVLLWLEAFFPVYRSLIDRPLDLGHILNPGGFLLLLTLTLLVGTLAGVFPAMMLASTRTVQILKGSVSKSKSGFMKGLVIFQFIISIALIISTIVLHQQLTFMRSKDPGIKHQGLLAIELANADSRQKSQLLKTEFLRLSGVNNATACSAVPLRGLTRNGYFPEGMKTPMMIHVIDVDQDFIDLFELELAQGRNFAQTTDKDAYLINETLARILEWQNPVGKTISRNGDHRVIGVVRDFHFTRLYDAIGPLIMTPSPEGSGFSRLVLSVNSEHLGTTLRDLQQVWKGMVPDMPFEYYFIDDAFARLYDWESRFKNIFMAFCIVAVIIALLGLYSLTAYSTERRSKEIGVRKALGASATDVITLFTRQSMLMVLISGIIATPLAIYAMHALLQNFAYRIGIGVWIILAANALVILMTLMTISYQTLKAANVNPVKTLRYE